MTERRCTTCGLKDHKSKECEAPGDLKDPTRDEAWEEYRERRKEAWGDQPDKGKEKVRNIQIQKIRN